MEEKKKKFLDILKEAHGIITVSCIASGISRKTYYNWLEKDPEFKEQAEDVIELQVDFVENKLFDLVDSGDTTAIIFYLKTKGKKRGYNERFNVDELQKTVVNNQNIEEKAQKTDINVELVKKLTEKRKYIKKLLQKQDKYTIELNEQIALAAQLLVKTETLAESVFSERHQPVSVEYSREGNKREVTSQEEKLYLLYQRESQRALRALGMNIDSKDRKVDDDTFNEFMKEFKNDKE